MIERIVERTTGTGRGVGITDLLHAQGEWPVIVLFAIITQLGDVWLLFLLGGVLYVAGEDLPRWGIDRRRGLFVLALVITYVGLIGALKSFFELPRPVGAGEPPAVAWIPTAFESVFASITTAEGPGFPSGHALGTTMVWGGLALVVQQKSFRTRFALAAGVVGLVSLSRLVLGVHYFVDVLVGAGLGVVVLAGLYWASENGTEPGRVLFAAVVAAAFGLLRGVTFDSVAAIGAAVGGWLVWRGVADSTPAHPTTRGEVFAGFAILGVAGALFGLLYSLDLPHLFTFLGAAATVGAAVGAPLMGERLM